MAKFISKSLEIKRQTEILLLAWHLVVSYSSTVYLTSITHYILFYIIIGPSSVGAMRLLNDGSTSLYNTAGRVQVWYGGQWGNICDDDFYFGFDEADVICHQLGWSGATDYYYAQYDRFVQHNYNSASSFLS